MTFPERIMVLSSSDINGIEGNASHYGKCDIMKKEIQDRYTSQRDRYTIQRDRYKNLGKTDTWLLAALLKIMRKKHFSEIAIKEITEEAGVDRRTFYRHFKSKEDLFEIHCQLMFADFGRYMLDHALTTHNTAVAYFQFWLDNKDFIKVLERHDLMYFFLKNYDNLMFQVAREVKPWNADKDGFSFDAKIRYHFFFAMGGLWGICYRWVIHGCKETPEALAQYVISFIVETYEMEPDCQHYDMQGEYPYDPCFVTPNPEDPPAGWRG